MKHKKERSIEKFLVVVARDVWNVDDAFLVSVQRVRMLLLLRTMPAKEGARKKQPAADPSLSSPRIREERRVSPSQSSLSLCDSLSSVFSYIFHLSWLTPFFLALLVPARLFKVSRTGVGIERRGPRRPDVPLFG